ncbi:MAG TPA: type II secretion system secretin GspD [Acetobacteraceae bacterium]|nr:type II secretion system secretin GspD [Acetobacteraceae bacterium]
MRLCAALRIGHRHALALLLVLAGCAAPAKPPVLAALPAPVDGAGGAAAPRINGSLGTLRSPAALVSYGVPPLNNVPPGEAAPAPSGDISLDFADTDIREVVAQILGNILKVNYTIDPDVHGTASLRTVQPLTRAELLPTLQTLLAGDGAALMRSGALYRVVPIATLKGVAAGGEGTSGSVVVALRYASADTLARVLAPYVGPAGRITAEPGSNALIVTGDPETRNALTSLIASFDTDVLAGQSYALLPVPVGSAKDVAGSLEEAFRSAKGEALAGQVRVLPMDRVNAILVVTPGIATLEDVRRVYSLLQRSEQMNTRSWHVYYLQNSNANDTAYVLQEAFTPNDVTASPPNSGRIAAQQSAELPGINGSGANPLGGAVGGSTSGSGTTGQSTTGQGAAGLVPAAASGAASAANPLLGGLDQTASQAAPSGMRIIANDQNNALLIYGTPEEYGTVEAMLRKIDILPLQVRIDATIAEVTLNDALQYGTQFFFRSGGINGILSNATQSLQTSDLSAAQLGTGFPGFIIGGTGLSGAPLAISALQAVTTVQVLSSPEIMVLDNQPAELQVGSLVPYLTSSSQSTLVNNAPVINSVNYAQTGVVMIVTPRVNSGGLVTLDITQQVSEVDTNPPVQAQAVDSPTFDDRTVHSRVVVQDGQTVGLAGLITDNVSRANSGIPWLKDIPLLGALAGTQNNQRTRTELLVLITPHVIYDQHEARALTEDMREQLINAALVPQELQALPASGSPDPNRTLRQNVGKWIGGQ